jgi:metaxin
MVAELYAPDSTNEILLADSAQTFAVQTLFKMCFRMKVELIAKNNASEISDNGYVPFIRMKILKTKSKNSEKEAVTSGAIVPSFEDAVQLIKNRQEKYNLGDINSMGDLNSFLVLPDENDKMSTLIDIYTPLCNNFTLIELFLNWKHEPTYKKLTVDRYMLSKPWPLRQILMAEKRSQVLDFLNAKGWGKKNLNEVENDFQSLLKVFEGLLEQHAGDFIFGSTPTPLDALVFGHLYSLYTTTLLNNKFQDRIHECEVLVTYIKTIEKQFFR